MNKIIYKRGSLFDVKDPNAILAHACNCKGVWGSGIAVDFKRLFPVAFKLYESDCDQYGKKLLGRSLLIHSSAKDAKNQLPIIACLFTSFAYGRSKDPEAKILRNTEKAVQGLLAVLKDGAEIHSPKINAGRFAVPWEKTATILEAAIKPRNVKWTVWEIPSPTK